jgi:hypothetical protein
MIDQGLLGIFSHAWIANLILAAPAPKKFCRRCARIPAAVVFKKLGHNLLPNSKSLEV